MRAMFLERTEGRVRLIADISSMAARFGLLVWLYYYFFKYNGGVVMGETLQTISWSMFFYFSFMFLNFRYLSRSIQREINTGQIEILLSKPVNYFVYKFSENIGNKLFPFTINLVLTFSIMVIIFKIPETMSSLFFVLTFFVTFIFCIVLSFLIYTIIGVLAFWLEDISPVQWVLDKFVMILGGSYLPVAFFPPLMKKLAIWSPFGASQFITHTVYSSWQVDFLKLILIQIFWAVVLYLLLRIMFVRAMKKVSVNGG